MIWRTKKKKRSCFSVGEKVRILNKNALLAAMNLSSQTHGIVFLTQMWNFCGQEQEIQKVVHNYFYDNKMISLDQPLYILSGLRCDGHVACFDKICDRCCYLLWREEWLEKLI